jgi:hypothetical protein
MLVIMHAKTVCRGMVVGAVLGELVTARGARAQQESTRFSWVNGGGADSCISEEGLHRRVVEMLGRDPFADPAGPAFSGVVRLRDGRLVAALSLSQPGESSPSTREITTEGPGCGPLSEAVALALALSLEQAASVSEPPAVVRMPPAPVPPRVPDAETGVKQAASRPATWSILGEARWTLGLLPRPTTGVGGSLRHDFSPRISAEVGGLWLPSASEGGLFSAGLAAGRLGLCVEVLEREKLSVAGCAYGLAGVLRVESEGAVVTEAGGHTWLAPAIGTVVSTRFQGGWVARAGAEGAIPLRRPIYAATACPPVGFQQAPVTLGLFVSLGAFIL